MSTPSDERLFELRQRVHFELDLRHVAEAGAHALDGGLDAAGGDEMVVLDQHRVVEAEAVIEAAAAAHGVFLQHAQARRRLARADDARLGAATASTSARVAVATPER